MGWVRAPLQWEIPLVYIVCDIKVETCVRQYNVNSRAPCQAVGNGESKTRITGDQGLVKRVIDNVQNCRFIPGQAELSFKSFTRVNGKIYVGQS